MDELPEDWNNDEYDKYDKLVNNWTFAEDFKSADIIEHELDEGHQNIFEQ